MSNPTPTTTAVDTGVVRQFATGATRDTAQDKLDFEGFLCPRVLQAYAEYMHKNRFQRDGSIRNSDNWQKGIPLSVYMKSMWRHFFDVWRLHRGLPAREGMVPALCGLLFNVMGYLHEYLKASETTDWLAAEAKRLAQERNDSIWADGSPLNKPIQPNAGQI